VQEFPSKRYNDFDNEFMESILMTLRGQQTAFVRGVINPTTDIYVLHTFSIKVDIITRDLIL